MPLSIYEQMREIDKSLSIAWSKEQWEESHSSPHYLWGGAFSVAEEKVLGFFLLMRPFPWAAGDSFHLLKFAVLPSYQNQRVGSFLLSSLLAEIRGLAPLYAEVAASNSPALHLYYSAGAKKLAEKPAFYSSGEKALVLEFDREQNTC